PASAVATPRRSRHASSKNVWLIGGGLATVLAAAFLLWSINRNPPDERGIAQKRAGGIDHTADDSPDESETKVIVDGKTAPTGGPNALLPVDYRAERKAARWLSSVLKPGSSFVVRRKDGLEVQISSENRALPEEDFAIVTLAMSGTPVTDAGLKNLAACT